MVRVLCKPCIECKKQATVDLTDREYYLWSSGAPLDRAVPRLSLEDRELLITGTHSECWDKIFADDEEDEYSPDQLAVLWADEQMKGYMN